MCLHMPTDGGEHILRTPRVLEQQMVRVCWWIFRLWLQTRYQTHFSCARDGPVPHGGECPASQ